MIIDDKTYVLPESNFVQIESLKRQIVICHSFNHDMRHFIGWLHRYNGKFKRTAPFTISSSGIIHQHFDPKFQSNFFNSKDLNNSSIVIILENDGWLRPNADKTEFITWIGDIYTKPNEVIEKKWRGYSFWSPYSQEQIASAEFLIKMLCDTFFIPMISISHNTKIDSLEDFRGILYRSNLDKHYTDLSPSWDCIEFKNKIEQT